MQIPEKDITKHSFFGGMDSDTAQDLLPPTTARYMLNVRPYASGEQGLITNIKGTELIATPLPTGQNIAIGFALDEPENKFYYFLYNSNGYHIIFMYDGVQNTIVPILRNLTDTNNVDILKFNPYYLITMADVIDHTWLSWVDGLNPARKFNINNALDKSSTGYGYGILESFINAYKKTAVYPPTAFYFTDATRNSNYLYGKLFKFCQWFIYDDGSISNISDYSIVPLPPNESYLGVNSISYANNGINVQIETGSRIVVKIGIGVQINLTGGENQSVITDFAQAIILDKAALGISDDTSYIYQFFNDANGNYASLDPKKVARPYSYLPANPKLQSYAQTAMIYGGFFEGFGNVNVYVDIDVSYIDIFLPDSTQNKPNNPFFQNVAYSYYFQRTLGIGHVNYTVSVQRFEIGFDVKKGNVFRIFADNGQGDVYNFSYTANGTDDATSVANVFKRFLRSIGRGIPDGPNGISDESKDGSGNVFFTYSYLGQYRKNQTRFDASVTPVNVQTLKDTGVSVKKIKSGTNRKYAFGYPDSDGRKTLAYTNNNCLVHTKFITESGEKKQPVHTISIKHRPPIWADKWQLLRTFDSGDYIQLLIQQVITVNSTDTGIYYDLVVGSLFTYQAIHPNTILAYQFDRNDRIKLIRRGSDGSLYPYFETEVLSYSIDTEEVKNENINTTGTDTVTIDGTTSADNIGKNILVNGFERTITAVASGNQYVLDRPLDLSINGNGDAAKSATYTLVDRRGIIRIRKPSDTQVPGGISNLSTLEISKPLVSPLDTENKIFYDFGMTFDISNPGTATRAHRAPAQNQDGTTDSTLISTPAIVKVIEGDAYLRFRELPTNNTKTSAQVVIDSVEDPNFSDFYASNLKDTGRAYPEYDGTGETYFGSRLRFSNSHIEDTKINGLNNFDNLDRKDYYDPYGDFTLIRYKEGRLYAFKELKTGWIGVFSRIISTQDGNESLSASNKLLNDLQYYQWQGGIGKNAESWFEDGVYQYFASANSGVFLRLSQAGLDPISTIYKYDKRSREILSYVAKYNLKIYGGFDRQNGDAIWSVPAFNNYIFNSGINAAEWNIFKPTLDSVLEVRIITPPTNGTLSIVGNKPFYQPNTDFVGNDTFVYQLRLPNGQWSEDIKDCVSVVESSVPVFYTATRTESFTKNDCGPNSDPTSVTYSQTYTSSVSQADAQSQADGDTNFPIAGQANANANGQCIMRARVEIDLTEQGDINATTPSYSDANGLTKDNGIQVSQRVVTTGTDVSYVVAGHTVTILAFTQVASTGYNPILTMNIMKNGQQVPTWPRSVPAVPDNNIIFEEIVAAGDVYVATITATADDTPPD